jgi:hypothetical protein
MIHGVARQDRARRLHIAAPLLAQPPERSNLHRRPAGASSMGEIMLNANGLWPQMTANDSDNGAADVWGLGSIMETQARLWNHMLDANRSVWEIYLPWFSAGPSLWTAALSPLQRAQEIVDDEATTASGVPDLMEMQARSWNQFLDANRSLWSAFGWPAPFADASGDASDSNEAAGPSASAGRRGAAARKRSAAGKTR